MFPMSNLLQFQDADSAKNDPPSKHNSLQAKETLLSASTMNVQSLQFPQGPLKPNPRGKKSLTNFSAKDKTKPVARLSSSHSVNLISEFDCNQVESWATEFDNLLSDPAGLQTFTEFLKKEFSHENIYFWCACEKYRHTHDTVERCNIAKEIVERHLDTGAWEPVNVDSMARSCAQESLNMDGEEQVLDINMFVAPQKQIYHLMKFDSYGRFLKSDLYSVSRNYFSHLSECHAGETVFKIFFQSNHC